MMPKRLSMGQKRNYLDFLIERDGGFICFYCKETLNYKSDIFDHLNDDWRDNRPENLVLCCQSCNNKKPYSSEMKNMASEKIDLNELSIFVGARKFPTDKVTEDEPHEISKEIDINTTNFQITEQHITEVIQTDGSILKQDALDSCVYICKKKTGHGSQQSVRNYIATLTSTVAPFEIVRNEDGKKVIVKRAVFDV